MTIVLLLLLIHKLVVQNLFTIVAGCINRQCINLATNGSMLLLISRVTFDDADDKGFSHDHNDDNNKRLAR